MGSLPEPLCRPAGGYKRSSCGKKRKTGSAQRRALCPLAFPLRYGCVEALSGPVTAGHAGQRDNRADVIRRRQRRTVDEAQSQQTGREILRLQDEGHIVHGPVPGFISFAAATAEIRSKAMSEAYGVIGSRFLEKLPPSIGEKYILMARQICTESRSFFMRGRGTAIAVAG